MTHDIIDNRHEKLVEHINRILPSTERAKFAVGYFFLSGLEPIEENLKNVQELRLLIGNTTNQETLEQISEGYKRLELVERAAEGMRFPKKAEVRHMVEQTKGNVKEAVEVMDQTDQGEALIGTLVSLIEEKRLKVKVYIKGRLHAKAYIFDYRDDGRYEKGIAVVGSSNLSLAGISHNTELNVVVHGTNNHEELTHWFEELWKESQDFDEHLMQELRHSWALAEVTPYDVYLKTLYALVKDRLEETEEAGILWDDDITEKLANFQKVAVRQAIQIIKDYGGCFVADVVGLGKSYIGSAIVKHFERSYHARPLIICPASLVEMWERYNETYHLNARVLSIGLLKEGEDGQINYLLDDVKYRDRDFVLLDESHNFRHTNTQRYNVLQQFLATGRRTVFLTATPRTRTAWDLYNQIKLFHQDDHTDLPIHPPNLKQYFKDIEGGKRRLRDLLSHILIRRTRNHILRWYGFDAETGRPVNPSRFQDYAEGKRRAYVLVGDKKQFFPKRKLETIEYSIEATYQGLYNRIRRYLGRPQGRARVKPGTRELTYARYGLWNYVNKEKQKKAPYNELQRAGANLRGLIRVMLFKRFESSVQAFRETLGRLHRIHQLFLEALQRGMVPAGDDAQALLYESDMWDEEDLFDILRGLTGRYDVEHFEDALLRDIQLDMELFQEMIDLVAPISPDKDAKLQTLLRRLETKPLSEGKVLIFTQYADTARYLYDNLNPGEQRQDIEVIYSGDKSKVRVVGRFAPKANPEYKFHKDESEINLLVATDVLSEGLNLQDGDKIINYDLHWNPVRLIQRFGRIDRIGSEHDVIWGFNFLPETELDKNLGLKDKLKNRIREIHETIGLDAAVLESSEQLNPEAMYAIYEKRGGQLSLFEEPDEIIDLNEAEEFMRQLKKENPEEFEKIANLRDGIRVGMASETKGSFVFCQAGKYQKLFLMNRDRKIVNQDISEILSILKCGPEQPPETLPADHNQTVMKARRLFDDEVQHRMAMREQTASLSHGQRYVIREMRVLFGIAKDEDMRHQVSTIEKAFRGPITPAINKELNRLRRNGVTGADLLKSLINIYHQHGMKDWIAKAGKEGDKTEIIKIICSEALI
jgi:hypothetical protein